MINRSVSCTKSVTEQVKMKVIRNIFFFAYLSCTCSIVTVNPIEGANILLLFDSKRSFIRLSTNFGNAYADF